jgi:hypothetical protein
MIDKRDAEHYIEGLLVKFRFDHTLEVSSSEKVLLAVIADEHPTLVQALLNGGVKITHQPSHKKKTLDYYDNRRDKKSKNFYPSLIVDGIVDKMEM